MIKGLKVRKSKKTGTIRTKLIIIPLVLVLIGLSAVGAISSYFMRESLLNEMRENGFLTLEKVVRELETNSEFTKIINSTLDDKIRIVGQTVLDLGEDIDGVLLKDIARKFQIDFKR